MTIKNDIMAILAILNHSVTNLRWTLESKNLRLRMVPNGEIIPKNDKDHIYGFTSVSTLARNMSWLVHPPLLWETATAVHAVSLSYPVIYMDAKMLPDGLISFTEIDKASLVSFLRKNLRVPASIKFEVEEPKTNQYGNGSDLSVAINQFLSTLPSPLLTEPTLIALASAIKHDWSIFTTFVTTNRLLTSTNEKQFVELERVLHESRVVIDVVKNRYFKKKGQHDKVNHLVDDDLWNHMTDDQMANALRVRFLLNYYSNRNIEDYLDDEDNVNVVDNEETEREENDE